MKKYLVSTISGQMYPFERIEEFADNGESLEVVTEGLGKAKIKPGAHLWQRFSDFLPFTYDPKLSLGEGNTPLLESDQLAQYVGLDSLLLKNETVNPTWSYKDRGSITCILMAKEMGETVTATISTGNMGASISAFAGRSDTIKPIVFIPGFCPEEKIRSMSIHGATIVRVGAPEYTTMKSKVLGLAKQFNLRIVSGNGPIRTEGYKSAAFELYEQMHGEVPDFIAVPTSACGNIRGIFKGYRELQEAGLVKKLPRMIIVQATNNSPLVSAWKQGKKQPIPFTNFHTVAEAITTGNPPGGDEILDKAYKYDWLAEDVSEEEILDSQRRLARAGFFVEPASATSLEAVKKLRAAGKIKKGDTVVLMLTGSGLKDAEVFEHHKIEVHESDVDHIEKDLSKILT